MPIWINNRVRRLLLREEAKLCASVVMFIMTAGCGGGASPTLKNQKPLIIVTQVPTKKELASESPLVIRGYIKTGENTWSPTLVNITLTNSRRQSNEYSSIAIRINGPHSSGAIPFETELAKPKNIKNLMIKVKAYGEGASPGSVSEAEVSVNL